VVSVCVYVTLTSGFQACCRQCFTFIQTQCERVIRLWIRQIALDLHHDEWHRSFDPRTPRPDTHCIPFSFLHGETGWTVLPERICRGDPRQGFDSCASGNLVFSHGKGGNLIYIRDDVNRLAIKLTKWRLDQGKFHVKTESKIARKIPSPRSEISKWNWRRFPHKRSMVFDSTVNKLISRISARRCGNVPSSQLIEHLWIASAWKHKSSCFWTVLETFRVNKRSVRGRRDKVS
jgi:hypothetical protein